MKIEIICHTNKFAVQFGDGVTEYIHVDYVDGSFSYRANTINFCV